MCSRLYAWDTLAVVNSTCTSAHAAEFITTRKNSSRVLQLVIVIHRHRHTAACTHAPQPSVLSGLFIIITAVATGIFYTITLLHSSQYYYVRLFSFFGWVVCIDVGKKYCYSHTNRMITTATHPLGHCLITCTSSTLLHLFLYLSRLVYVIWGPSV